MNGHSKRWICLILFGIMLSASGCGKPAQSTTDPDTPEPSGTGLKPAHGNGEPHGVPVPVRSGADNSTSNPILIRSDFKPGEVKALCDAAIADATRRLDRIAKISANNRSFKNTMYAFETITADLNDAAIPLTFMGYVSTDPQVHDEGSACENQLNQYLVSVFTRKDLYDTIRGQKSPDPDQARLLSETLKGFEQNGLQLPADQLAQVKDLKQKLAAQEAEYTANYNNNASTVTFTAADLRGVSVDFLGNLQKTNDGNYIVTTKDTDYNQVMQNAVSTRTREQMLEAYWNRAASANTKALEDAIQLRQQIAKLMGYPTWADYRIHGRMAQDAKTVLGFLNSLKDKLAERARQDVTQLKAFKATLPADESGPEVKAWDLPYLSYQLKKSQFNLDDDQIRAYFPADVVIQGLFDVYSKLLGVKYVKVSDPKVWASGVELYEIHHATDNSLIGFFYTDFYPRPRKYGHAASFPLISGRQLESGAYSKPVSAIVANVSPRLNHDEVTTIFHEFGHIMHQTLTKAPYASLSGSNVAQDFVEAPSQMLENWPWDGEILKSLSGRYDDHSQKLPDALLKQMIAARDFQQGYYYTRQLMLALLDMKYHTTDGPVDTTAIYQQLYHDMIGIDSPAGTHFQAGFSHLMGGYDAGYYGYLWSEVYAADMFTRFQGAPGGLLDPSVGLAYRATILERGNMQDALDLLKAFLGRAPNPDAFLKKLHL